MQHTVDTLMELAYNYADEYADTYEAEHDSYGRRTAREALRTALTEALKNKQDLYTSQERVQNSPESVHIAHPSTDDKLRIQFESEYRRLYPVSCDIRPNKFERDGEDSYAETIVNVAWNLWKAAQPVQEPLTSDQLMALTLCHEDKRVSVSKVQRILKISYKEAQELCQAIIDAGQCEGFEIAPNLHRIGGDK